MLMYVAQATPRKGHAGVKAPLLEGMAETWIANREGSDHAHGEYVLCLSHQGGLTLINRHDTITCE